MTATTMKILVAGDVQGNFKTLFKRVETVNKKSGPFDMLLCVGEFFSSNEEAFKEWEQYLNGMGKVPVATYILGPTRDELKRFYPDMKGCELGPNITYLGDHGVFTSSTGLKLAYLSGKEKTDSSQTVGFDADATRALEIPLLNSGNFQGVDVLLTSQWPKGVDKHAAKPAGLESDDHGSVLISRLAQKIKPRYHFAGLEGIHYERAPYRNHQVLSEVTTHVTRFIGLGKVGNPKNLKWLYAFSLVPLTHMDVAKRNEQPADVTPSPYDNQLTQTVPDKPEGDSVNTFFFDANAAEQMRSGQKRGRHGNKGDFNPKRRPPPQPMGPCWFCLSSAEVEKHLVVSVGDSIYLALPKGALTFGHVLILPVGHYQSLVDLPNEALEEVEKFKLALQKCFQQQNKCVVFFERNFKSPHLQIQCIPLPLEKKSLVKDVFMEMAAKYSINLDELPEHAELRQVVRQGSPYFFVEMPTKERFLCHIRGRFPLQFGREVLADRDLLNVEDRVDWKKCGEDKTQEAENTARFRKLFQSFDFTV